MTGTSKETAHAFADVARDLSDKDSVQETLQEIVSLAVREVNGCEFAGISLLEQDDIRTQASTDPRVEQVDLLQRSLEKGPCREAVLVREVLVIDDMAQETRWPEFVTGVHEIGVRSMMVLQLFTRRRVLGVLTFQSTHENAFDEDAAELGRILAAHAAVALSSAQSEEGLRGALHTRERIGEATGIVMERYKLTGRQAFSLLVRASQNLNIKLRDLAEELVHTGAFPVDGADPLKSSDDAAPTQGTAS